MGRLSECLIGMLWTSGHYLSMKAARLLLKHLCGWPERQGEETNKNDDEVVLNVEPQEAAARLVASNRSVLKTKRCISVATNAIKISALLWRPSRPCFQIFNSNRDLLVMMSRCIRSSLASQVCRMKSVRKVLNTCAPRQNTCGMPHVKTHAACEMWPS